MRKTDVEVTDEKVRQVGEECSTFSEENWHCLTPAQQEELVKIRARRVMRMGYLVAENEEIADIREKMDELRSREYPCDEATRDLYFSIPDEAGRVKAIGDLLDYESARKKHDHSMVLEAYYRFVGVQRAVLSGWTKWPEFKVRISGVAILCAIFFVVRLIWPDTKQDMYWSIGLGAAYMIVYGMYWDIHLRNMESRYFLLWEIEKLRRGVDNREDLEPPRQRYELFGDEERGSGKRSVPREIPWPVSRR